MVLSSLIAEVNERAGRWKRSTYQAILRDFSIADSGIIKAVAAAIDNPHDGSKIAFAHQYILKCPVLPVDTNFYELLKHVDLIVDELVAILAQSTQPELVLWRGRLVRDKQELQNRATACLQNRTAGNVLAFRVSVTNFVSTMEFIELGSSALLETWRNSLMQPEQDQEVIDFELAWQPVSLSDVERWLAAIGALYSTIAREAWGENHKDELRVISIEIGSARAVLAGSVKCAGVLKQVVLIVEEYLRRKFTEVGKLEEAAKKLELVANVSDSIRRLRDNGSNVDGQQKRLEDVAEKLVTEVIQVVGVGYKRPVDNSIGSDGTKYLADSGVVEHKRLPSSRGRELD